MNNNEISYMAILCDAIVQNPSKCQVYTMMTSLSVSREIGSSCILYYIDLFNEHFRESFNLQEIIQELSNGNSKEKNLATFLKHALKRKQSLDTSRRIRYGK